MIINPQVGMRVIFTDRSVNDPEMMGRTGTIEAVWSDRGTISVSLDTPLSDRLRVVCYWNSRWDLLPDQNNEEVKDRQRRQAYADKYL